MPPRLIVSPRAADRLDCARVWLRSFAPASEVLVVASGFEAADDLVRSLLEAGGARFGIHRLTFNLLIGLLAADDLAAAQLVPADGLAAQALAARAAFRLAGNDELGYFTPVGDQPGFPAAVARTLAELRLNRVAGDRLRSIDALGEPLAALLAQFEAELRDASLTDRAGVLATAVGAARRQPAPRFVGLPTLLLDIAIDNLAERDLIAALAARSPRLLATVPAGDERALGLLTDALGVGAELLPVAARRDSLDCLQAHLFSDSAPQTRKLDDSVTILSAPGESRECVEIARQIQTEARRGVPFDQMAVFLHSARSPAPYVSHLEEALARAGIPAWFASGTVQPEPGGRALLTLLACAAERLSARRWAEYLSLAQVPDSLTAFPAETFVPPDPEMGLAAIADSFEILPVPAESALPAPDDPVPVFEGSLRAPWRWEELIVDASVIGKSTERWRKRLDGLQHELEHQRAELEGEDAETRAASITRKLVQLGHLRRVALAQMEALAALPESAPWGDWLAHLRGLVNLAIRDREPVLAALAELEPMAPVGPVELDEVRLVLKDRLSDLVRRPTRRRYGAVMVATAAAARGLEFEVVFVPGLSEKMFPRKLVEDPLLPDAARRALEPSLVWKDDRVASERLALRLAVGAARSRLFVSWPRIDIDLGRPRVPSFYVLELMLAAEGRLGGFEEMKVRAAAARDLRLGWPAPKNASEAIDDAEFDLASLDKLLSADPDSSVGAARYLLDGDPANRANPHLARALRARAYRWLRRWTPADGLVDPEPWAAAALARHQLAARAYSPTALQHFAACPYRFFLQAIHRLEPREEPEAIEVIDPLVRGSLFHEVQFSLLSALRSAGALPVDAANLEAAFERMEGVLAEIAARYHDQLAPAIERVWSEGISLIRADLREWLRRMAADDSGWSPDRFELSFGLKGRGQADPQSRPAPVALEADLNLRGSIDLVERRADGSLRATDHKTGRSQAPKGVVVGGGEVLQPLLYALAAEQVLGARVEAGRLYYCTSAGNYEERVVALDEPARMAAAGVIKTIDRALRGGFLPAAPAHDKCRWCDYRLVCGPYEELRVRTKPEARLRDLAALRAMR